MSSEQTYPGKQSLVEEAAITVLFPLSAPGVT